MVKKLLLFYPIFFSIFFIFATPLLAKNDICEFIINGEHYQEYLAELKVNKNDYDWMFWVIIDVDDGLCKYGGYDNFSFNRDLSYRDIIKLSYISCNKRKEINSLKGTCTPFAINENIVWQKPDLYAKLNRSSLTPFEEIEKSIKEENFDWITFGMWENYDAIEVYDKSSFDKVVYIGEEKRKILEANADRSDKSRRFYFKTSTYVFDTYFENGTVLEMLVYFEKEKSLNKAKIIAAKYSRILGQMPNVLLQRLDAAHIYADVPGISNASASTRVINIHPIDEYNNSFENVIEELFIHELVHASLDKPIYGPYKRLNKKRHENKNIKLVKLNWSDWRKAVKGDKKRYVNNYAKTTIHEDLAESFIAWLSLRYGKRTSVLEKLLIEKLIPNRIKFFDEQNFDMYP